MSDNGLKPVPLTCHAAPDGYQQADKSCAIVLGWFTVNLANVFFTKLKTKFYPKNHFIG